ncbi:MAG TPA: SUMF1/EgtB/PvdO family nonheme iron enzyme, partial [Bacteroidales bacterium]|nr:SUMF1/EgtB/PvdO family nonheme iron enzyme [Bacteroidales bacterium]
NSSRPFSASRMQFNDLLELGILEEYIQRGGKTEGKDWLEFYKSLLPDFHIDSIQELKTMIEIMRSRIMKSKMIQMIDVEGGSFIMGGCVELDEGPEHEVQVSSYQIARTPVTQEIWERVMGVNPSSFKGPNRPVNHVHWYEVVEFCNKLSKMEGFQQAYFGVGADIKCDFSANGYRLPTEAEWEFAARGGNKSCGYKFAGGDKLDLFGWYYGNSGNESKDVGLKLPNELGIHDMSGNVWEWCWDLYSSNYYGVSPIANPLGADAGPERVLRGGSWSVAADSCRVSYRDRYNPGYRYDKSGFRVARTK